MEINRIYGTIYNEDKLNESLYRDLIRALLFCQSYNAQDAFEFIHNFKNIEVKTLEKALEVFTNELSEIKSNLENISINIKNSFDEENLEKLNKWQLLFGELKDEEIKEYIDFYDISNEKSIEIKKIFNRNSITKPDDIRLQLDNFVIGQEKAKTGLSYAIYLHLIRSSLITPEITKIIKENRFTEGILLPKPNIILIGPTGCGKTYILKTLCNLFEIPFIKVDCASMTSSGYVGNNLTDCIWTLYDKFDSNLDKIKNAIIFFDEFDKISGYNLNKDSVGGIELQQEFLNFLEDKEIHLSPRKNTNDKPMSVPTSNFMFVFSGSFAGIEDIIKDKFNARKAIGFSNDNKTQKDLPADLLDLINYDDIIKFGLIPELVGRVNHIITLKPLTKDIVISILKDSKESPLKAYKNYFWIHDDELIIEEDVYDLIAEKVLSANSGARGISAVLHNLLKEFLYSAPNTISEKFVITKEYFNNIFDNH